MSYSSIGEIQAAGIGVEIDEIVGCCNWKAGGEAGKEG